MTNQDPFTRRRVLSLSAAWAALAAMPRTAVASGSSDEPTFVADVVREVARSTPKGNVVLAPLSLQATLALAAVGSRGDTRRRLQAALGLADLDPATIHTALSSTAAETHRAVFLRGVDVDPSYVSAVSNSLYADVRALSDNVSAALQAINDWSSEATHGRVRQAIDRLDPSTRIVLADAVYLKFGWRDPFNPKDTRELPFHRHPGDDVPVPMMTQTLNAYAGERRAGTFVHLPFADNMHGVDLVLPRQGMSADESLDLVMRAPEEFERRSQWRDELREVHLKVPKLLLRSDSALSPAISQAGLPQLFERADLSGVSPQLAEGWIGALQQSVWMKVDEQGVEAAAVTSGVAITGAGLPSDPPLHLTFDRPFALVIRDRRRIVFAAIVRDPSETV